MSSGPQIKSGSDFHASKAPQFYAAAITSYGLAVAAVALRFWARKLMKTRLWVDDWAIAGALLVATGFFANAISWLHQGFGHHYEDHPGDFPDTFGKNLYIEELLYFVVIGPVKLSMLAFYWRLFRGSIRIPCYILGAIIACWELAVILATVFQCIPISGLWTHAPDAKCVSNQHLFIGTAVPNIVTNLALLALPVPYIWRLHTTASQKIALTGSFMLGGFVTIISLVRLTILFPKINLNSTDLDYSFVNFGSWSIAESNMAVVAACLPSLGSILSLMLYGDPDPSARHHARGSRSWWSRRNSSSAAVAMQPRGGAAPTTNPMNINNDSRQKFIISPLSNDDDMAFELSGMEPLHAVATSTGCADGRKRKSSEDVENQWVNGGGGGRGIEVRTDVTVQLTPKIMIVGT